MRGNYLLGLLSCPWPARGTISPLDGISFSVNDISLPSYPNMPITTVNTMVTLLFFSATTSLTWTTSAYSHERHFVRHVYATETTG